MNLEAFFFNLKKVKLAYVGRGMKVVIDIAAFQRVGLESPVFTKLFQNLNKIIYSEIFF